VRSRARSALSAPITTSSDAAASPIGAPAFIGSPSGSPLACISPLNAWAVGSIPGRRAWGPVCPNVETETRIARGLRSWSVAQSSPSVVLSGPRMFSTTTSAHPTSARRTAAPSGVATSATTLRLLRLMPTKKPLSPARCSPRRRASSPAGGSSLTTSAPRSPSSDVPYGPAIIEAISSTRTPASGAVTDATVVSFENL